MVGSWAIYNEWKRIIEVKSTKGMAKDLNLRLPDYKASDLSAKPELLPADSWSAILQAFGITNI